MQRFLFLILFFFMMSSTSALTSYVQHSVFMTPSHQSYLETYLSIPYSSLTLETQSDQLQHAKVDVLIYYKNSAEDIVAFEKVTLNTEGLTPDLIPQKSLIEIFRKELPDGNYTLEVNLKDALKADAKTYTTVQKIIIESEKNKAVFSDIELVENIKPTASNNRFSKGNIDLLPYTINYFPTEISTLQFYTELYNTHQALKDEDLLILYSINDFYKGTVIKNIGGKARVHSSEVVPVVGAIDIKELESGTYKLKIEAIDKNKNIIAQKTIDVFRVNDSIGSQDLLTILSTENFTKFISDQDLRNVLASHIAISDDSETQKISYLLKTDDTSMMRIFIFNFWYRKDPVRTQEKYSEYIRQVNEANELFGQGKIPGFTTDRGKVYLKYGKPDNIVLRQNPEDVKPYSIWFYNAIGNQFKVKFVFIERFMKDEYPLQYSTLRASTNSVDLEGLKEALRYSDKNTAGNEETKKYSEFFKSEGSLFWQDFNLY